MNTNDAIRAALADPRKRLPPELEAQLDEEVEALLSGFDCYSVPYSPERGPLARPDFHSAAIDALGGCEELIDELVSYYVMVNREDGADWGKLSKLVEPILEGVARSMILKAWLGMGGEE